MRTVSQRHPPELVAIKQHLHGGQRRSRRKLFENGLKSFNGHFELWRIRLDTENEYGQEERKGWSSRDVEVNASRLTRAEAKSRSLGDAAAESRSERDAFTQLPELQGLLNQPSTNHIESLKRSSK